MKQKFIWGGLFGINNSLKLRKFKEKNNKRKIIVITIIFSIFVLSSIYLYNTFAVFSEEKHFNVINGKVQDPGDIYFAYYVDNNITRELPKQNTGYTLDIEKSNCTNGVTITWNDDAWAVTLNYQGYNKTDYTRTKCNLYFAKTATTGAAAIIKSIVDSSDDLVYDDAGNIRYIGSNPNNYVSIDEESWRIIGVMKGIDDGTGNKSDRVKIIRNESIGSYSWDSSASSVNSGYGVNEWSQADLMKLLNPGYESESIGGSLYWNNQLGKCYSSSSNGTTSCDFTKSGIKNNLKNLIDDAIWNIGTNDGNTYTYNNIIASKFYELERSDNTGKNCTSGQYCNDVVERTTTWTGKVGLMYPSDYGYATSGGSTNGMVRCVIEEMYIWNSDSTKNCKNNDWLLFSGQQWTLTACANVSIARDVFCVNGGGNVANVRAYGSHAIRPVVYLKSNVKILNGDGSESNPYILSEISDNTN